MDVALLEKKALVQGYSLVIVVDANILVDIIGTHIHENLYLIDISYFSL